MNGRELLNWIRSSERFRNVTVVMFSTAMSSEDQLYYKSCGADACLKKPGSYTSLCEALRQLLDVHRSIVDSKNR
jgi:CheY-like chemotaxis protein